MCAPSAVKYMISWPPKSSSELLLRTSRKQVPRKWIVHAILRNLRVFVALVGLSWDVDMNITRVLMTPLWRPGKLQGGSCPNTFPQTCIAHVNHATHTNHHTRHPNSALLEKLVTQNRYAYPHPPHRAFLGRPHEFTRALMTPLWSPAKLQGGSGEGHNPRQIACGYIIGPPKLSKCCEKGMCARFLVNYMLPWPSPRLLITQHEVHRRV